MNKNEKTENLDEKERENQKNEINEEKNNQEKTPDESSEIKNLEDRENKDEITPSLEEEIIQLKEEKLRLLAEMDNLRKRTERDKIDSIKYGSINLARDILSPNDNLTRALESIPEKEQKSNTISNLIDGLRMVQKEFSTILEKHGIKKIDSLNNKFDHNYHQAMMEIENDEVDEGFVVEEMQSGYIMHGRLLRPSMVGVSKKPNKDEVNSENKEEKKP